MFTTNDFGVHLKRLRKRAGLSQAELGHAIGRGQSAISGFETGEMRPSAENIAELANILDCTPTDFFLEARQRLSA